MKVNHVVEKPDGSLVFQGVLEGRELMYVIEQGLDTIIAGNIAPFLHTASHEHCDIHNLPESSQ